MFLIESEGETMSVKPMNCPGHFLTFASRTHSYRDLPVRYHEQTPLHRNEASGVLSGLTRVRQFSQDDAHCFVTPEQIGDEVERLIALVQRVYGDFGLPFTAKLSTMPDEHMGEVATWEHAEAQLKAALERSGLAYDLNEKDGAFYGPKIDFDVTDAIGRKWQCATIQLDYMQPENFDLKYIGADNSEHRPVVIHRAIFGSFERFIAILIEHYAGAFPLWLAPVQAIVLPIADRHFDYARSVRESLRAARVRVNERTRVRELRVIDDNGEQLGIVPPPQALAIAKQKSLDLVEISPTANPPVCRIMDFGKYQYQEQKRAREAKKHQKVILVKEIKFRPKVDEHDYQFKKKHIERFLEDGDKVKATIFFRGREMAHPEIGRRILERLVGELADLALAETMPRMEGNQMHTILTRRPQSGGGKAKAAAAAAAVTK